MRKVAIPLLAMALVASCNQASSDGNDEQTIPTEETDAAPTEPVSSENPASTDFEWTGRWPGVEGMYLDITQTDEPGHYSLEMQYDLDNSGTYEGVLDGEAIAFERNGETLLLTRGNGDATGLRYLVGMENCLIVAEGEGYCRE